MSTKSRYIEIYEAIQSSIASMSPNSLMPTEQQLAKRFGVSRVTIRRALGLLERGGQISRERGRGTIVNPPKITRRIFPVSSIEQNLREHGRLETRVVQYEAAATPPKHIGDRLHLAPEETAGFLTLLRLVEDRIICLEWRYFSPSLAKRFDPVRAESETILHVLRELAGMPISTLDWETEVAPAPYPVASALGITPGALVFVNTFTNYLENGEPVQAGAVFYRIDHTKFEFQAMRHVASAQ
jgi:GntR family transcriptional regulator